MRRGRPAPSPARPAAASPAPRPVSHQPPPKVSGLPPSSSSSGDPFAALDSRSPVPGNTNTDEFSSRFPSLDQFSLLHDQGSKFEFESTTPTSARPKDDGSSSDPNLHRMADEAFASSRSPPVASAAPQRPQSVTPSAAPVSAPKMTPRPIESLPRTASGPVKSAEISRAQSIISSNPDLKNISTQKLSNYVSTGTSTSDLPLDPPLKVSQRISQIQATASARQLPSPTPSEQSTSASAPNLSRRQEQEPDDATPPPSVSARVSSFESPIPTHTRSSSASRNSIPRRTEEDLLDIAPARSARQRPQSTALEPTSTMDYLREREASSRPQSRLATTREAESRESTSPLPWANLVPTNDESPPPAAEPTNVDLLSGPEEPQRPVEPAVTSSSSPKPPVSSNFGDAFKRFEGGRPSQVRSPSPLKHQSATPRDPEPPVARPVPAPTDKDPEEMTPEQRREMERIMLLEEEQRVEAAQAEYRKRVAAGGAGASGGAPVPQRSSSTSIQSRVQGLMAERQTNVPRTAHGYGKYSDAEKALPEVPRKPVGASGAPPSVPPKPSAAGKPVAPKKPARLNSLPTGASGTSVPPGPAKRSQPQEQLVAVDLPGQPALDMTAAERDSYLEDFSARFPSLSSMEGKS